MSEQQSTVERQNFDRPPLPRGWTYLVHGTDTTRWPVDQEKVTVRGLGLSVLTAEDIAHTQLHGSQYNTTANFARSKAGASPVRLLIPFYQEELCPRYVAPAELSALKASLGPATTRLIAQYYYANSQMGRHPLVPQGEVLHQLGVTGDADGWTNVYLLPGSVAEQYVESVRREYGTETVVSEKPEVL